MSEEVFEFYRNKIISLVGIAGEKWTYIGRDIFAMAIRQILFYLFYYEDFPLEQMTRGKIGIIWTNVLNGNNVTRFKRNSRGVHVRSA
jgi:hypothetical protein